MALPKKLRMASTTLPTMAGNASTAFPASLLSASANLSNHFFKSPSFFDGEPPPPPSPPPKTPEQEQSLRWSLKGQSGLKIWLYPIHEIR